MCFLNQVIKVLVAAAISGAECFLVWLAHTHRTVFIWTRASIRCGYSNKMHTNVSLLDIQPLINIIGFDEMKKN
ncbi:hypothetical protein PO909_014415 [Leuciscus waleckii]